MSNFVPLTEKDAKNDAIANTLKTLTDKFKEITEFHNKELKALSVLQTDTIFKELLEFYVLNKKHVKRKYAKEILQALDKCTKENQIEKSLLNRLLRRDI